MRTEIQKSITQEIIQLNTVNNSKNYTIDESNINSFKKSLTKYVDFIKVKSYIFLLIKLEIII